MGTRSTGVMVSSGAITFGATTLSGFFGLFGLLLALNGFMGHESIVNFSIVTYIVFAIAVILSVTLLSALTANFVQKRFDWGVAAVVITSSFGFAVIGVVIHIISIVIAAIVADQMRTTR